MTKKPHAPGWDFRDMLSPRDPDSPGDSDRDPGPANNFDDWDEVGPESGEPEPGESEMASHFTDWDDAEAAPEPEPEPSELVAAPEPGFALVEADEQASLQERLQSLLASAPASAPLELEVEAPSEPEAEAEPAPVADEAALAAPEVTAPHWPFGLGWLESDEPIEAIEAEAAVADLPPSIPGPGLMARLRNLLRSLRRTPPPPRNRRPRS
jgi:hypothetical protein